MGNYGKNTLFSLDSCSPGDGNWRTQEKPSLHARRIYADAVGFTDAALAMAVNVFGSGKVLYGPDYPHTIGGPIACLARVARLSAGERVRAHNAEPHLRFALRPRRTDATYG